MFERDEKSKRIVAPARPAENAATNLDRLIHERTRLAIISALAVNDSLSFNELKQLLSVTDGNLSVHARKARGRRLYRVHQILRQSIAEDGIPPVSARPARAGKISRPHGGADSRHARPLMVSSLGFLSPVRLKQSDNYR